MFLKCLTFMKLLRVLTCPCSSKAFIGRRRGGRLVSWVEKASLEHIRGF